MKTFEQCIKTINSCSIGIGQVNLEEFEWLWNKVKELEPSVMLEIGSRQGGSLYCLANACKKNSTIISIDLPGANWGFSNSLIHLVKTIEQLKYENFKTKLIIGDSQNPITLLQLKEYLDGKLIEVLFIDGDHKYPAVKKDWEMYSPLVKKGGIIAFHDIVLVPENAGNPTEVHQLWDEIKDQYEHESFIGYCGIGIIYK